MRRGKNHFFVSHLLKNGSEIAFSFLFVFVAYAANAQEAPYIPVEPIAQEIAAQLEAQDQDIEVVDGTEQKTNELIVQVDENTSNETVQELIEQSEDVDSILNTGEDTYVKITVPESEKEQIQERLEDLGDVQVEPNVVRRATAVPNDTNYSNQWYHDSTAAGIGSEEAWDVQTGSEEVVVAVIDSGVDTDHVDLADNMWVNTGEIAGNDTDDDNNGFIDDVYGYDFVDDDGDPNPSPDGEDNDGYAGVDTSVDHGTHVAGIIGAVGDNAEGVAGVSWDVSIMAVKVLNDEGSGTDADIVSGIEYAVENGADIINLSLGGYGSSSVLQDAIQEAGEAGVLIVAAAGNDGVSIHTNEFFPACYDNYVIAVSSVGATGIESSFSNFANGDDCVVDVAGPGELIYSTLYTDDAEYDFTTDYGYLTGTSMATPVVVGVAALLKAEDSTLDRVSITNVLESTARDIDLPRKYGTGLVDASAALAGIADAHDPIAPARLRAFKTRSRNTEFTSGRRERNKSPFFSWPAATDIEGVAGYYVYFGRNSDANPVTEGQFQTGRTYQASGLRGNGRRYYLRVKAVDTDDNVSSEVTTFTYIIDRKVPKPKRIRVKNVERGIRIKWRRVNSRHRVRRYVIRRSVNGKPFKKIKRLGRRKKKYIDRSVKEGKRYRYRVRAIDDVGNKKTSVKKRLRRQRPTE
jgi:subtilisin family serine protease